MAKKSPTPTENASADHAGQGYFPGTEPREIKKSRYDEDTEDIGWARVTKKTRFDFNEDTQDYERSSAPPTFNVRIHLENQEQVKLEIPPVMGLDVDQVGGLMDHVEQCLGYYKGLQKELQEQLNSLHGRRGFGETHVTYVETKTSVRVRKRNEGDVPGGSDAEA